MVSDKTTVYSNNNSSSITQTNSYNSQQTQTYQEEAKPKPKAVRRVVVRRKGLTKTFTRRTIKVEPVSTQTYGDNGTIKKTMGYDSDGPSLTDKTVAHNLGIGDEVDLHGRKLTIVDIISGDHKTHEAVIYKVKTSDSTLYALKLYYKFTNPKDEPNSQALERIQKIIDPDILNLHDFGTGVRKFQHKFCFELCDFAKGSNLLAVDDLKQKYTAEFIESNVIVEIFKGIRTLHDYKIYHCDIKPENIFYLDEAQTDLVIGDYGSSKTFEETSDKQLTHTSTTKGTSFYLAPEQPRGIVSEKNDYYSFGMILLHLLYPQYVNRENLRKIIERQFSRKPIIDFVPEYDRLNTLIAGLTLYDINTRWGEAEVKGWLRGEKFEVKYHHEAQATPIKVGKTAIKTVSDLVEYIESTNNWHEILIEDQEGYNQFLRWVSELQDIEKKKIFDKMVRHYQQDGIEYLKQAVLRYFMPERPIHVDMKEYNFWAIEDISDLITQFIGHLDDIWKITPLEKLKLYLFQLEFTLRQIHETQTGKNKILITSLLEKISSAVKVDPKENFKDYICVFYPSASYVNLLNLFYSFDEERSFRDLEGKSYKTIEEVGLFFAANEELFDNSYLTLERKLFLKSKNLTTLIESNYKFFLYSIFSNKLLREIELKNFESKNKGYEIVINLKSSIKSFLLANNINNITDGKVLNQETITLTKIPFQLKFSTINLSKLIENNIIETICKKYNLNYDIFDLEGRQKLRNEICSEVKQDVKSLRLQYITIFCCSLISLAALAYYTIWNSNLINKAEKVFNKAEVSIKNSEYLTAYKLLTTTHKFFENEFPLLSKLPKNDKKLLPDLCKVTTLDHVNKLIDSNQWESAYFYIKNIQPPCNQVSDFLLSSITPGLIAYVVNREIISPDSDIKWKLLKIAQDEFFKKYQEGTLNKSESEWLDQSVLIIGGPLQISGIGYFESRKSFWNIKVVNGSVKITGAKYLPLFNRNGENLERDKTNNGVLTLNVKIEIDNEEFKFRSARGSLKINNGAKIYSKNIISTLHNNYKSNTYSKYTSQLLFEVPVDLLNRAFVLKLTHFAENFPLVFRKYTTPVVYRLDQKGTNDISINSVVDYSSAIEVNFSILEDTKLCFHTEGIDAPYLETKSIKYKLIAWVNILECKNRMRYYNKGERFSFIFEPLPDNINSFNLYEGENGYDNKKGWLNFTNIKFK